MMFEPDRVWDSRPAVFFQRQRGLGSRPEAAGAAPLRSSPANGASASRRAAPATIPFRGAKHFPTAAPTVLRWESAFALLSHRESNKEVTSDFSGNLWYNKRDRRCEYGSQNIRYDGNRKHGA